MKKILKALPFLFVGVLCAFALAGCAGGSAAPSAPSTSGSGSASSASDSSSSSASGSNAVVVYFSGSGNTARIAQEIADDIGSTTFQITPVEVYTEEDLNWRQEGSRVNREHEDESLRAVALTSTEVPDWDSYDIVFIGYPIWWGIAAWPVDGFVSANDFTGKTVIPFCTSTSSGMGQSAVLLEQLAGTGDWQEGMRFSSGASQADVQQWVDSLEL